MTLREQIIHHAMALVGTPWHHRAMVPGVGGGIDCARVIEWVAKQVGLLPQSWQIPEYSQEFNLHHNEETLLHALVALGCVSVPMAARQPGDILLMQYGRISSHTAFLVTCNPDYILHAASDAGRVVHQRLDAAHLARVRGVYAFPGVEVAA